MTKCYIYCIFFIIFVYLIVLYMSVSFVYKRFDIYIVNNLHIYYFYILLGKRLFYFRRKTGLLGKLSNKLIY